MQRLVKWCEREDMVYLGGARYDVDFEKGAVFALDLDFDKLKDSNSELWRALTFRGRPGKIVSHTFDMVSSQRVWTFVLEF